MAKFFGKIGFIRTVETRPDIWEEEVSERDYIGDFVEPVRSWHTSDGANDDVELRTDISVIMDPFANENYPYARYVVIKGVKWKVKSIRPGYPRLVLSIGGVYNGRTN